MQPNKITFLPNGNLQIAGEQGVREISTTDAEKVYEALSGFDNASLDALLQVGDRAAEKLGKLFMTVLTGVATQKNIVKGSITNVKGDVKIGDTFVVEYKIEVATPHIVPKIIVNPTHVVLNQIKGRTNNLLHLKTTLENSDKIVVQNGVGGIGKTVLAASYVAQHKSNYDHLAWINLDIRYDEAAQGKIVYSPLQKAFVDNRTLTDNLGITASTHALSNDSKYVQGFSIILNKLQDLKGKHLLIIDDNANVGITQNDLTLLSQLLDNWKILLLSRQRFTTPLVDNLKELDYLDEKAAKEVFRQYHPSASDGELDQLFLSVQKHPLLLILIASNVHQSNGTLSIKKVATNFKKRSQHPDEGIAFELVNPRYKGEQTLWRHLHYVFDLSLANFSTDELHLLRHFAVLPLEGFSVPVVAVLIQSPYEKRTPLINALNGLYKTGWLKKEQQLFSTYSLVQQVCLSKYPIENDEYANYLDSLHRLFISNDVEPLLTALSEEDRHFEFFPNGAVYITQVQQNINLVLRVVDLFEDLDEHKTAYELLRVAAEHYKAVGNYANALAYFKSFVDATYTQGKDTSRFVVDAYDFIIYTSIELPNFQQAQTYLEDFEKYVAQHADPHLMNRLKLNYLKAYFLKIIGKPALARPFAAEALQIAEVNSIPLGAYQTILGLVLQDLGEYEGAKKLLQKALQSAEQNFGVSHPSTASSYSNLALVLKALGEYEGAKELLQKALQSDEQNFGVSHPNTAGSYSNLAMVLQALGEYEGAKKLLQKALQSDEQNFGVSHPTTAIRYSNLAMVLQELGEYEGAKELLEKALQSDEQNFGVSHPSTARNYSNLAMVLKALGEYEGAKELFEKALQSDEQNFGVSHPSTAISYSNLGVVLKDLGEYEGAKELFEKALYSNEQNFGVSHPSTAISYSNLGVVLQALGEYEGAKELFEKALYSNEQNFGVSHPTTASSYSNLAAVLKDLGEYEGAKELLQKALRSDEQNFGVSHPSTAISYSNLALVLKDLRDYEGAMELLQKALYSNEQNFGVSHPSTAISCSNLAMVLQALGEYEGAKELFEKALYSAEQNFGVSHPTTAINYSNLATVLQALEDYEGAKELLQKTLHSAEQNFGGSHPTTAINYSNLATVLQALGDYEGAKELLQKAYLVCFERLGTTHPDTKIIKRKLDYLISEI